MLKRIMVFSILTLFLVSLGVLFACADVAGPTPAGPNAFLGTDGTTNTCPAGYIPDVWRHMGCVLPTLR